jgi:hypothetical protein
MIRIFISFKKLCYKQLILRMKVFFAHNAIRTCQIWKCYNYIFKLFIWNNRAKVIVRLNIYAIWNYIFSGFISFAKQKLKSVQENFKTSTDPSKTYAQYFTFNQNDYYSKQQYIGYARSYTDHFNRLRKDKIEQVLFITKQLLLRVELLTNKSDHIPPNGNTKERRSMKIGSV